MIKLKNELRQVKSVAIAGHVRPDGDCTGSCLAVYNYIREHFPGVKLSKPQGTYMLFLDCTEWCAEHGKTLDELLRAGWDVGVIWQDGRPFHGPCAIRVNLALPESLVKQAMERLKQYVFQDCR